MFFDLKDFMEAFFWFQIFCGSVSSLSKHHLPQNLYFIITYIFCKIIFCGSSVSKLHLTPFHKELEAILKCAVGRLSKIELNICGSEIELNIC